MEAVTATCEKAGSIAYWLDPLSGAIFADESGTEPLTEEDVTVAPLDHAWGEPTYTWNEDNASVTARCICQRDKDHVLEETVKTTVTTDDKTGKTTWTAQFENEVFTTQTVSVSTGLVISPSATAAPSGTPTGTVKPTSAAPTRGASGTPIGTAKQVSAVPTRGASGNTGVSNNAVKNASATPAAKTSNPSATKSASVSTGDDNDPALWFTLLTAALACIAAMFTLRRSRHSVGR